jgi:UDP:flavonoid glycosyltransferase YjiC (YdhE family)
VDAVLTQPSYRAKARALAEAYASYPGAARAAEAVLEVARDTAPVA